MKKYIGLLGYSKNFRILTFIQLICYFGMWFSHTGIFALLIKLNAPVWAITLSATMAFIPNIILAPINGVIIDKFKPKPMLIFLMAVETITVFMLVFIDDLSYLILLLLIIFIRMGAGCTYFQIEMSVLPKILSKKHVKLANEIHSVIWASSYTAGMGLAGIFIYHYGVDMAFIFDGVLYTIGLFALFRLNLRKIVPNPAEKPIKMIVEGFKYLKQNPLIVHLIFLHAFVGFTAYDNLIALMAGYKYKEVMSASLVIGFINMTRALSLIVGPIILSKFTNTKNMFYFFVFQFIGISLWAVLQFNYYIALIGLLAAGFWTSTIWSYTFTLLQNHCSKEFYGRVIAYNDMIYFIFAALTSVMIGVAFKLGVSLPVITFFIGMLFLFGAFYYKFVFERYRL